VALWALIGDANETYNLTNIGTLFAFALVSAGVLCCAIPNGPPSAVQGCVVWVVAPVSVVLCVYVMFGLPLETWIRFAVWLAIGLALYVAYGFNTARFGIGSRERGAARYTSWPAAGRQAQRARRRVDLTTAFGNARAGQVCREVGSEREQ